MPSFRSSLVIMAMAIMTVHSQSDTAANYGIDPDSVPIATRANWCQSQIAACPLLCLQNTNATDTSTAENDCDADTLVFSCICGNGISPNFANFSQTIPFFECQEYGNQCVTACGNGNSPCANACRVDHPCGAQNPTRVNSTTSSGMAVTATSSGGGGQTVYTGLGDSSKKSGSRAAIDIGRSFGLVAFVAGLCAGFAVVL